MKTIHWFVERLQNMNDNEKKDIYATVRFLNGLQELVHTNGGDDYEYLYEIIETIGEIDSGIAEVIGLHMKRSLELSDTDLWEALEPVGEEEQALADEYYQRQREEFL